jgi:hypothetical protein
MGTQKNYEDIKKLLKEHRQSHLLAFWDHLNTAQKQNLLAQVRQLDFVEIDNWVADCIKKSGRQTLSSSISMPKQSN